MADGVSAEILAELQAVFALKQVQNAEIQAFLKKLHAKKATQADVSLYAARLGELLRDATHAVLTAAELPNETLYYNIMQDTVGQLLKNAHALVNDAGSEAQRAIDEENGLGLQSVTPEFPQRRVNDLFYKAGAPGTTRDRALRILDEPLVTLTQSFHDDHVRANAAARYKAGMAPQIVRTAVHGCCAWCSRLDGSYPYGDVRDTGNDVFRRHERCRCTVDYVCDGKAQNVWSKESYSADADTLRSRREYGAESDSADAETLAARRAYREQGERQKPEEIEAAADRAREEKGLAFLGESGIIREDETISLSSHNLHNSSDVLYERVKHVQPIDGYDDVFLHGDAWGVSTRNADGTEVDIPNDEFIRTLKMLKLDNSAIRLCSCSAGEKDRGLACLVAREMDMPVMASTTDVWIDAPNEQGISTMRLFRDNGKGKPDHNKPGRWRIFMPDGSIKEVKT